MRSDPDAPRRWLTDIQENISKAERFISCIDLEQFLKDDLRFYATTRCLEIISEASRRLPDALKSRHPTIPWNEIAAAGNMYRHDYASLAKARVWNTLRQSLPTLRKIVEWNLRHSKTAHNRQPPSYLKLVRGCAEHRLADSDSPSRQVLLEK